MSTENNTGITWNFNGDLYGDLYFLRDDEAAGICDYERHSLFRTGSNYGRVTVRSGSFDEALPFFHEGVRKDRLKRGCRNIDPLTVFLYQ